MTLSHEEQAVINQVCMGLLCGVKTTLNPLTALYVSTALKKLAEHVQAKLVQSFLEESGRGHIGRCARRGHTPQYHAYLHLDDIFENLVSTDLYDEMTDHITIHDPIPAPDQRAVMWDLHIPPSEGFTERTVRGWIGITLQERIRTVQDDLIPWTRRKTKD